MRHQHPLRPARIDRSSRDVRSQHFLRDPVLVARLVDELPLPPGSLVVEPGAGRGIITRALADRGFRVIAVEKDVRLFRALRSRFIGRTNVEIHHADILDFSLPREPYTVVSNVPFAISAQLIRKLLAASPPPEAALLVLQREAAAKFAGAPQESLFSLLQKPLFAMSVAHHFARDDFSPPPPVDAVLLRISRRDAPLVAHASHDAYRRFIIACWRSGAPDVRHALRPYVTGRQLLRLARDLGFSPRQRPSELTFQQWAGLFRFYELSCMGRRCAKHIVRYTRTGEWRMETGSRTSDCYVNEAIRAEVTSEFIVLVDEMIGALAAR